MNALSRIALFTAALTFASCGEATLEVDVSDSWSTEETEATLNSTIYDRAYAYAQRYPKRDGATWNQWCASLVWRFGQFPESSVRPSAIEAYRSSSIVSTNAAAAPTGAIHWWDIGQYGHVGVDLNGGGTHVFMASYKLAQSWGDAIGWNSVGGYNAASGAQYLGWSMDYAGSRIAGGGQAPGTTPPPNTGALPRTSTEQDGIPGSIYYKRIQTVGRRDYGYTGAIDGVTGPNTEKLRVRITARELNRRGGPTTSAENDGVPGPIYWKRVQTVGRDFGYSGPIDGIPGANTYKAEHRIAGYAVNRAF